MSQPPLIIGVVLGMTKSGEDVRVALIPGHRVVTVKAAGDLAINAMVEVSGNQAFRLRPGVCPECGR